MKKPNRDLLKGLLHGRLTPKEFVVRSQQGSRRVSFLDQQDGQYFSNGQLITEEEYHSRVEVARKNRTLIDFSQV